MDDDNYFSNGVTVKVSGRLSLVEIILLIICLVIIPVFPSIGVLISFILVLLYLCLSAARRERWNSIGFHHPGNWLKAIGTAFILAFILEMGFEILLNGLIERVTGTAIDLSNFDSMRGNFINYLIWLLIGWGIGGFLEEMLFRGFLITRISRFLGNSNLGDWAGIVSTSVIFGLSHLYQGPSGMISTGLIAVFLGIIFIRNKMNIWVNVFTHGFINLIGLTVIYFDLDQYFSRLIFN